MSKYIAIHCGNNFIRISCQSVDCFFFVFFLLTFLFNLVLPFSEKDVQKSFRKSLDEKHCEYEKHATEITKKMFVVLSRARLNSFEFVFWFETSIKGVSWRISSLQTAKLAVFVSGAESCFFVISFQICRFSLLRSSLKQFVVLWLVF